MVSVKDSEIHSFSIPLLVDVNIGDTAYSITDIKDAINAANLGATASVVKKGATDFALVIRAA